MVNQQFAGGHTTPDEQFQLYMTLRNANVLMSFKLAWPGL